MFLIPTFHLKWIASIARNYRWRMCLFFLLEITAITFSLLFIYFSKKCIDVALSVVAGEIKTYLFLVILFSIGGIMVKSLSQWINQQMLVNMAKELQYEVLQRQMLLQWKFFKRWNTGDLLVRLNSDTTEIVQMISTTWISFVITCIKILASFLFLFSMDKMLANIILCITPLFLFSKIYLKKLKILNTEVKAAESKIGSSMQENLRHRIILRAMAALAKRLISFGEEQTKYATLKLSYVRFSIFSQGIMRVALTVGYLIAFAWGVYKLQNQTITFGTMTAFLQLVNQIQSPILTIGAFFPAFVRFGVSLDRVKEIYGVEREVLPTHALLLDVNRLVINDLTFSYDNTNIINNLSVDILKGDTLAITGASGQGKTTLVRLLLGLLAPDEGNMQIISQNETYHLNSSLVDNFSYVPQGNSLLAGTIRDNILMGDPRFEKDDLSEILYYACAEFVHDLPNGLDTNIGESGLGLSEGQAQRIAIARALARNRSIWLFDEATSALDKATTNLFLSRIKDLIIDKIVIFVTHDRNVIDFCQKKIELT